MAASSKLMITDAERRFPIRIRIGVPLEGLGSRLDQMRAWLDANCGADGWALTPSGMRGVLQRCPVDLPFSTSCAPRSLELGA
jgi:hypothetical protein